MDGVAEVPLPFSVDRLITEICVQKFLPLPDSEARMSLSMLSEVSAIDVLRSISLIPNPSCNFSKLIVEMVNTYASVASCGEAESIRVSSNCSSYASSTASSSPKKSAFYDSPTSRQFLGSPNCYGTPALQLQETSSTSCSRLKDAIPTCGPTASHDVSPLVKHFITALSSCPTGTNSSLQTPNYKLSQQSTLLVELEFRKLFMVYSYIGSNRLEDAVSVDDAIKIYSMKNMKMFDFEDWMWSKFGSHYCQPGDRAMYLDWDSGKTHLYTCYVHCNGDLQFKGPYLDRKKTHLQRSIGEENVLIVKFAEASDAYNTMTYHTYENIAEAGIVVGLRRYRFFIFKDGGKERKNNGKEEKKRSSGVVKCYFIKRESIATWVDSDTLITKYQTTHDVRCLFMHVHTVPSMAKYIARMSLILSTTIKLQVDLASVSVEEIDDIPCIDEKGCIVCDEDGEPLIQTDGTGFISEDLAALVPNDFFDAKFMKDKDFEKFDIVQNEIGPASLRDRHYQFKEPPLLIQCRLYHEGTAVKGTLLVNKKLKPRTIQVRPSMIKVRKDPRLSNTKSFDSLEVNSVSHKPNTAKLSKYLIALLSIGGVPKSFFLDLLKSTLEDVQRVCFDPRAAFRVAHIYQHIDDSGISMEMIGARIPLSEPYFRYRLSLLSKEERKGLGEGKLPVSDSFYLMGTTDPTGILNSDEVCVVLENGQLSGKVLVYRNPGLHFGDIHVLNARYVKELEDYIGNSKYAIFFSTKGKRSVANEIATGDFDGDLYWVCKNAELLKHFKASEPWKQSYSTPSARNIKPSDLSSEELEHLLFRLLFSTTNSAAGIAADSWMVLMDDYLMLQDADGDDDTAAKKDSIKKKMLKLIDLYYDALDAPKTGKKVVIPESLKATRYPHYMDRKPEYLSTSILGLIYDAFHTCKNENLPVQAEIWKLPYFNVSIPDSCLKLWKARYFAYKDEMSNAMELSDDNKNEAANDVIRKYKQMLYDAPDFKDTTRNIEDVYNEALAIYHVTYDNAISKKTPVARCGFAWKVAGSALCSYHRKIHCMKTGEREITFVPSAFDGVF